MNLVGTVQEITKELDMIEKLKNNKCQLNLNAGYIFIA